MFGYVTIYQKDLDNAAMDCYQAYYCGLCQSLGRKYGTAARMALSYAMTFAALASSGLGNNIRAQNEARTAVDMEPGNYEYQNLLDRLQNPGRAYSTYQQAYTQPGSRQHGMNFCLQAWLYLMLCNLCSICCCGGRGGFYIC